MSKEKKCFKKLNSLFLIMAIFLFVAAGSGKETRASQKAIKQKKPSNLIEARGNFQTRHIPNNYEADGPAVTPPKSMFNLFHYKSNNGNLVAYITPDPKDGIRHPAIIWAHGGFGGIGSWLWERAPADNDQSAGAFLDAGIVTMCPSWRGENDNPGQFELFYGEVEDLLSAFEALKQLPYVDPNRIYLAGHSTGGTMALLGSVATNKFRAIFSFGGAPDLYNVVSNGEGYGNTPFDYKSKIESYYRSPIAFVDLIKSPTFYFEGENSFYCGDALLMESKGKSSNVPFKVFIIKKGTHFNILRPLTQMVAHKILSDTGKICNISITAKDVIWP